jgi:murein DD-endopeptidase MepM/ murein hydrolase activator NlpD
MSLPRNRTLLPPRALGQAARALLIVALLGAGPSSTVWPVGVARAAALPDITVHQDAPGGVSTPSPDPAPNGETPPASAEGAPAEEAPAPDAGSVVEQPSAAPPTQADAPVLLPSAAPASASPPSPSHTQLYVVKAGDTLFSIARRFNVGVDSLAAANKLTSVDAIREGQKLVVPVVAAASTEPPTPIPPTPIPSTPPADAPVEKPSAIPISLFPTAPSVLVPTPTGSPSVNVTTARVPKLVWPIDRKPPRIEVTQSFHPAHRAIDIGAPEKTAIKAAAAGVVRLIEKTETPYGWVMVIDHGNDISTWYAHLSSFSVKKGDKIDAGQKIGEVGNTGRSTGPHLHFELRIKNTPINPRLALP